MFERLRRIPLLVAVVSGCALGMPFIVPALWPLALVGLVPLLYALRGRTHSVPSVILSGIICGGIVNAFAFFGMSWDSLPLDWLGLGGGPAVEVIVGLLWIVTAAVLAPVYGLFTFHVHATRRQMPIMWLLHTVCAWVLVEWLSAFIASIIFAGPETLTGAHFTMAHIGYLLANDLALLQLASIGGVYLLSATAVLVSGIVVLLVLGYARRILLVIGILLLVPWVFGTQYLARTPMYTDKVPMIGVAAVHTRLPTSLSPTEGALEHTHRTISSLLASLDETDLIILPESTEFLARRNEENLSLTGKPFIIDSTSTYEDEILYARMLYRDTEANTTAVTYKNFLLPYGEYMPYLGSGFLTLLGEHDTLATLQMHRGFARGPAPTPVPMRSTYTVGALFCSETLSPTLYRSLARDGASVFVNAASHSWFHDSRIVYTQMRNVARVRAVESNRWYVQATNGAPAFILDPYGRITQETTWNEPGIAQADIELRTTQTIYTRFGPWVLLIPLIIILTTALPKRRAHTVLS